MVSLFPMGYLCEDRVQSDNMYTCSVLFLRSLFNIIFGLILAFIRTLQLFTM